MSAEPKEPDEISLEQGELGELSLKQELALRAVISQPTLRDAARAAGVSAPTLWRYMQDEAFSRRLKVARREVVDHAFRRLQGAADDAVTALHDLVRREDTPARARIAAARSILEFSFRAAEYESLRARIDELEEFIRIKQEQEEREELEVDEEEG
jgi:hypothetical protein